MKAILIIPLFCWLECCTVNSLLVTGKLSWDKTGEARQF
ncbi:hypothetical protein GEOBRER4_n0010 [Citrifermentans bremense]|uniref:Uncharacterized protein n=1 Tax=Citrifermentans bremense TaxID=60035 RepID=A0A7R7FRW7_9BACT|nr:hypothetical protein GEOBRER4_n0010 [Citrifermentans bremense]